jgi:hypothetical protein
VKRRDQFAPAIGQTSSVPARWAIAIVPCAPKTKTNMLRRRPVSARSWKTFTERIDGSAPLASGIPDEQLTEP